VRTLLLVILSGCGSSTTQVPVANPARPAGDCATPPAGKRSLVTRIEVERGDGALALDGASQAGAGCRLWDLPPGTHHVEVSAEGAAGFGVHATMKVVDPPTEYDLFDLACGLPGSCDTATLRAWETAVVADRTRMTDPCSAAKLTGIRWDTEQLDDLHPKKLKLSFDLHVYSKPSGKPPHDPSCPEK
jgi:hypothetical protein